MYLEAHSELDSLKKNLTLLVSFITKLRRRSWVNNPKLSQWTPRANSPGLSLLNVIIHSSTSYLFKENINRHHFQLLSTALYWELFVKPRLCRPLLPYRDIFLVLLLRFDWGSDWWYSQSYKRKADGLIRAFGSQQTCAGPKYTSMIVAAMKWWMNFPCVEKLCKGKCSGKGEKDRDQRFRQICSKCRQTNVACWKSTVFWVVFSNARFSCWPRFSHCGRRIVRL